MADMKQREIVTIHLGQGGVQIGDAMWELYCLEHAVHPDGKPYMESLETSDITKCLFTKTRDEKMVPRAMFVDTEPTVVDEIKQGAYRNLFHPELIINSIEDASNNYSRGYFVCGRSIMPLIQRRLSSMVEQCSNLQGILVVGGLGGGTGSGVGSLLMRHLDQEYGKKVKLMLEVAPGSRMSNIVVEPYNCALCTQHFLKFSDMSLLVDNETLYERCVNNMSIVRPTYTTINRVLAQVFSSITCPLRYPSSLNSDLPQMMTNLIPYPRLHFPIVSYAPLTNNIHSSFEDPRQLTKSLFLREGQLMDVVPTQDAFMSCCIQYRGDISLTEVTHVLQHLKSAPKDPIRFVDWCPTGFKIGLCNQPPLCAPGSFQFSAPFSAVMTANNSAVGNVWRKISQRFDCLMDKRAFMHWFVSEGLEEGEFVEARNDMEAIVNDYEEAGKEVKMNEESQPKEDQTPRTPVCSIRTLSFKKLGGDSNHSLKRQSSMRNSPENGDAKRANYTWAHSGSDMSCQDSPSNGNEISPEPMSQLSPANQSSPSKPASVDSFKQNVSEEEIDIEMVNNKSQEIEIDLEIPPSDALFDVEESSSKSPSLPDADESDDVHRPPIRNLTFQLPEYV